MSSCEVTSNQSRSCWVGRHLEISLAGIVVAFVDSAEFLLELCNADDRGGGMASTRMLGMRVGQLERVMFRRKGSFCA